MKHPGLIGKKTSQSFDLHKAKYELEPMFGNSDVRRFADNIWTINPYRTADRHLVASQK